MYMRFNQQILVKHEYGITAQWVSEDFSYTAIATYYQQEKESENIDGELVKYKTWVLGNCSGPWTGITPDKKELIIIDGYEKERNEISGQATLILTCINASTNGNNALNNIWKANKIGFE